MPTDTTERGLEEFIIVAITEDADPDAEAVA